jgi:hypothetical protein
VLVFTQFKEMTGPLSRFLPPSCNREGLILHGSVPAGCGNIHFPPNGTADYDYSNPTPVLSEADDWLNFPQFQGTTDQVDCESWGGPDYQRNYLLWWYERLPHITGGRYSDGKLLNWWGYLLDMNEYPESR